MRLSDPLLRKTAEKITAGERLDFEDAMVLYRSSDLNGVGLLAHRERLRRHGLKAFFIRNQHLNYSNVCRNRCVFCAYAKNEGDPKAYTLSLEEVRDQLTCRASESIREIHMVGGLNPRLDFQYFENLLLLIREVRPEAVIKAFTAVELDYLSGITGYSIEKVVLRLKEAGLAMMPGGGAEVLNDRIHKALFPKKITSERWLEIIETVHDQGIPTNATMLYGHLETHEERVEHLLRLRDLQDRTGGFSAFIPLAFHSANTPLAHLPPTSGVDDLRTIAVSRLLLDNFDHIKAYWVMLGEKLAQTALYFGADDMDGTIVEERITHTAGATSPKGMSREALMYLIESAGMVPVERDSFYNPISGESHGNLI
ncbi:aminofutalosine synthase MqnE [Desulfobotulus sp. H1]|uniref:Aminodeoxyfutalosine synthase n=1 Tax=Desulfobotulus pelophilus TaxID=2823377 RepID=A0ABT3N9E3_9BACT|nr:aminofutalosine synthase MqnE [Desulfobotulus pelophilus]MCW7754085.1 aminofutalosine synthase MqnE [Desulfobotulus pelophilus]